MEHVNAKYLRALADGKTILCRYFMDGTDENAWFELTRRTVAHDFLFTGIQDNDQAWHVELRIKGEECGK